MASPDKTPSLRERLEREHLARMGHLALEWGFHSQKVFLRNVKDARDNGYEVVCAGCGVGVLDGSEEHERGCPGG